LENERDINELLALMEPNLESIMNVYKEIVTSTSTNAWNAKDYLWEYTVSYIFDCIGNAKYDELRKFLVESFRPFGSVSDILMSSMSYKFETLASIVAIYLRTNNRLRMEVHLSKSRRRREVLRWLYKINSTIRLGKLAEVLDSYYLARKILKDLEKDGLVESNKDRHGRLWYEMTWEGRDAGRYDLESERKIELVDY